MDTLWAVFLLAIGVLPTIGGIMLSVSPPDFRGARVCFWASAFLLAGWTIAWFFLSDPTNPFRLWVAIAVAALVLAGLPGILWWIRGRERSIVAQSVATSHSEPPIVHNVASHNQSGGITAHTVNQAPSPQLIRRDWRVAENADGTRTLLVTFEVVAPYPPPALQVSIQGPDIRSFDVKSERPGVHLSGHSGVRDGYRFTTLQHPSGRYRLTTTYGGKAMPVLGYAFD
jgi:hypothetical protein